MSDNPTGDDEPNDTPIPRKTGLEPSEKEDEFHTMIDSTARLGPDEFKVAFMIPKPKK
ncbi:hypothetical protein [Brevundimonas naejangsanensis]|uniref:hypothetical protein n=1 Tax=Brevundimonas naejangsanensis TaxID=588932 RepID=UPI0014255551|nr:hypothetical protein [Brevundimonas naejangsanensis]